MVKIKPNFYKNKKAIIIVIIFLLVVALAVGLYLYIQGQNNQSDPLDKNNDGVIERSEVPEDQLQEMDAEAQKYFSEKGTLEAVDPRNGVVFVTSENTQALLRLVAQEGFWIGTNNDISPIRLGDIPLGSKVIVSYEGGTEKLMGLTIDELAQ